MPSGNMVISIPFYGIVVVIVDVAVTAIEGWVI